MPDHARARVVGQHPLQLLRGQLAAVGHADLAGVDRAADADAAAVVDAHPGRARGGIDQGVQQRPVGNRVRAIQHRLRLSIRRRHRSAIQMVAPHHHRSLYLAFCHQIVHRQPELVALPIAQPADARRQPLKFHALLRQFNPAIQMLVLRKHFQHELVRSRNVRSFARKSRPPERSFALAKQRPDVCRYKSRKVVSVLHALFERKRSNVVPIIKRHRAQFLQFQHSLDMLRHGRQGMFFVFLRTLLSQLQSRFQRHSIRHVPADGIVRARLVRQQVRHHAALRQFRDQVRAISHQSNRSRLALAHRVFQNPQRLVQRSHHHVAITALHAPLDALRVHIDPQKRCAIHRSS